ncbi:MAG: hypothetical protein ACRDP8_11350 [Actinopolymorphaceae bacterium]
MSRSEADKSEFLGGGEPGKRGGRDVVQDRDPPPLARRERSPMEYDRPMPQRHPAKGADACVDMVVIPPVQLQLGARDHVVLGGGEFVERMTVRTRH